MVFSLGQVEEKCIVQHMDIYGVFVDLTNALIQSTERHSVSFLQSFAVLEISIRSFGLWIFHNGMMGMILSSADVSTLFISPVM